MTYVVKRDDTLSTIAQRELGDASRYMEIARLNRIKNPDLIHPGDELELPPRRSTGDGGGGFFSRLRQLWNG